MAHRTALSVALAALLLPALAHGAENTEVVDFLHGNVEASFGHHFGQGTYKSDERYAGSREIESQLFTGKLRFGAFYNLEVYLGGYFVTWDRVRWQNIQFAGPNIAPAEGGDQVERRRGFGDLQLGVKYALLNAQRRPGDLSNWTIEAAFTIPTGGFNPYPTTINNTTTNADDVAHAGVGGGGVDWLFQTSFSRRIGRFDPYASFYINARGVRRIEGGYQYNPGNSYGTLAGVEVIGFERKSDGLKFAADGALGWDWKADGETYTNRFLYGPSSGAPVAPGTVREQGQATYFFRLGFNYQVHRYMRVRGMGSFYHPDKHFMEEYDPSFTDTMNGEAVRDFDFTEFRFHIGLAFTY